MRNERIKKNMLFVLNAIIPLLLGLIVYVCDRPDTYISEMVYSLLGFRGNGHTFPKIIDNHLPDFVWAYSLMLIVFVVTGIYKRV